MSLFSFIKDAGEKLFGIGEAKAGTTAAAAAPAPATPERVAELNKVAGDAIAVYIQKMGLPVSGLVVEFDGATAAVTVSGTVADQATKEKVVLCCGNVQHVSKVNDMLTVETPQPESQMHVVEKGDNLSKISARYYGTPNKYMAIFEANKPMLSHPDKIYPGQALRIPPAA
jgi:nucleoid-associated protein YgaU